MILDIKNVEIGSLLNGVYVYINEVKISNYTDKYNTLKKMIRGNIQIKGKNTPFVSFDDSVINFFLSLGDTPYEGVYRLNGSVGEYKKEKQVVIQGIGANDSKLTKEDFTLSLAVDDLKKEFVDFVNTELSSKAIHVMSTIFKEENLMDAFKTGHAGSKMHDAKRGGLINHELKMLKLTKTLISNDKRLAGFSDLMYLGIIMHDIGKIEEMKDGVYQKNSYITHRVFGVELMHKYKNVIVETYSIDFYYQLLAIIQGHHGAYGESPKTVWAYIVHCIDALEAAVTGVLDNIENENFEYDGNHKRVYANGEKLVVY